MRCLIPTLVVLSASLLSPAVCMPASPHGTPTVKEGAPLPKRTDAPRYYWTSSGVGPYDNTPDGWITQFLMQVLNHDCAAEGTSQHTPAHLDYRYEYNVGGRVIRVHLHLGEVARARPDIESPGPLYQDVKALLRFALLNPAHPVTEPPTPSPGLMDEVQNQPWIRQPAYRIDGWSGPRRENTISNIQLTVLNARAAPTTRMMQGRTAEINTWVLQCFDWQSGNIM